MQGGTGIARDIHGAPVIEAQMRFKNLIKNIHRRMLEAPNEPRGQQSQAGVDRAAVGIIEDGPSRELRHQRMISHAHQGDLRNIQQQEGYEEYADRLKYPSPRLLEALDRLFADTGAGEAAIGIETYDLPGEEQYEDRNNERPKSDNVIHLR